MDRVRLGTANAIAPGRRHRADYRDELGHVEVARIMSELPVEHPARIVYSTGAREAADSISLAWLVADRRDMVQAQSDRLHGHADACATLRVYLM